MSFHNQYHNHEYNGIVVTIKMSIKIGLINVSIIQLKINTSECLKVLQISGGSMILYSFQTFKTIDL